jgi:hypothetical protein
MEVAQDGPNQCLQDGAQEDQVDMDQEVVMEDGHQVDPLESHTEEAHHTEVAHHSVDHRDGQNQSHQDGAQEVREVTVRI